MKKIQEKIFCKCGCDKEIIIKPQHKYYGIAKYIRGHQSKGECEYFEN